MNWYLIRGLSREAAHWAPFPELLQKAFPGSKILTLDLPGNGRFFQEKTPPNLQKITQFARREILGSIQGTGSQSYFIGLSLGAMVMIDWLSRFPGDADGGVMINTSMGKWAPLHQRLQPFGMLKLAQILKAKTIEEREHLVLEMTSNRPELYAQKAAEWSEIQKLRPVTPLNTGKQLLAAALFKPPVTPPPHPLLVLTSKKDRMVHTRCSQEIAKHWNLPIATHPDAGHDIPLDDPSWVIEQIQSWVALQKPSAKS